MAAEIIKCGRVLKETPMLMKTEMVQAILRGWKTQTRRIIKPQPLHNYGPSGEPNGIAFKDIIDGYPEELIPYCPFGRVGDLIWLRETWAYGIGSHGESLVPIFKASNPEWTGKWKSPIHLKKKDARLWLRIVKIGVQEIQKISGKDCVAEGIRRRGGLNDGVPLEGPIWKESRAEFKTLWNSINLARGYGWDCNPWCWVVKFELMKDK